MIYLIQGFFFQNQKRLGLGTNHEGSAVFFKEELYHTMYAGILYSESGNERMMVGEMMDQYGESILTRGLISDTELRFIKRYGNRSDLIDFKLTRQKGKIWIGTYSGSLIGEGSTQCILTKIPKEFLVPPVTSIDAE